MTLEELNGPFVALGGRTCRKRAEVPALAGPSILLSGVQTVFARRKLADHLQPAGRLARASSQESTCALLPDEMIAVDDHFAVADDR